MKYAALFGLWVVVAGSGCTGLDLSPDFGPYPASSLGGLAAGISDFINTGGSGTRFTLLVVNADDAEAHTVTISADGGAPITQDIAPCDLGGAAISCAANSVVVTVTDGGGVTITIQPDPFDCENVTLYISGDGTALTLSETPPTDSACEDLGL